MICAGFWPVTIRLVIIHYGSKRLIHSTARVPFQQISTRQKNASIRNLKSFQHAHTSCFRLLPVSETVHLLAYMRRSMHTAHRIYPKRHVTHHTIVCDNFSHPKRSEFVSYMMPSTSQSHKRGNCGLVCVCVCDALFNQMLMGFVQRYVCFNNFQHQPKVINLRSSLSYSKKACSRHFGGPESFGTSEILHCSQPHHLPPNSAFLNDL